MFNLLPQTEKETIRREYRFRLVIVALGLTFVTLLIAGILLVPSVLLSSQKEEAAERRFEVLMKSVEKGKTEELDKTLLEAKALLGLLPHEAPLVLLHELLLNIVSAKTNRISLGNFSLADAGEGKQRVDLSGVAKDRTALVAFVKSLEQSGLFEKVEVPISNFAKDTDIEFSIVALRVPKKPQ